MMLMAVVFLVGLTGNEQSLFWVASICIAVLLLTYKLTITIDKEAVRFSMGIGLIRGEYPVRNIVSCRSVSYLPFGWGVRFRPGVMIFNVSGNKALELELMDRKMKVWIGTDNPEALVSFLHKIKRQR